MSNIYPVNSRTTAAVARFASGAILALLISAASPPAGAQTVDTYGPGIAQAVSTAKSPRDFRGVWVQRVWVMDLFPNPPLRPELAKRGPEAPQDTRLARCLPNPWPRHFNAPYPIEIFQFPDVTLISYEVPAVWRRIWTDGRKHPEDAEPSWLGHSIGWWEGDVFVIDTVNVKNTNNEPSQVHSVEKYRLSPNGKQIEMEITVTDPDTYTRPVTTKRTFYRTVVEILEWECNENNRNNPDNPGPLNLTHGPAVPREPFGGILTERNVEKYVPEAVSDVPEGALPPRERKDSGK
jgi:hypothetical protein